MLGNGGSLLCFLVEVGVVQLEEDPLGPSHIPRVSGVHFSIPVISETCTITDGRDRVTMHVAQVSV